MPLVTMVVKVASDERLVLTGFQAFRSLEPNRITGALVSTPLTVNRHIPLPRFVISLILNPAGGMFLPVKRSLKSVAFAAAPAAQIHTPSLFITSLAAGQTTRPVFLETHMFGQAQVPLTENFWLDKKGTGGILSEMPETKYLGLKSC